jgi:1-acyl-sn-glycerol-3-phosphate acyltransferase
MAHADSNRHLLDDEAALAEHIATALEVTAPGGLELEANYRIIKRLFKPTVVGADNIPDRPCLFIGNHSLFALDGMVLQPIMQKELGRFVRGMGDRFLFNVDRVGKYVLKRGAVMGHPQVCSALMEAGQDLLVFPGGAHEAVKPASELYSLQWKERFGFVKLAARHGYTIAPFGIVGPDEFYSHLMEGKDLPDSALGQVLRRLGILNDETRSDMLPPIPLGALGSLLPKPQACYIGFGKPVNLARYKGKELTRRQLQNLRGRVAKEVEEQVAQMLLLREQNRASDGLLRRLLTV